MKKKLVLLFVALLAVVAIVHTDPVLAADYRTELNNQLNATAGQGGAEFAKEDPRLIIARIIRSGLTFVGTLMLAYLFFSGYLIMTAAGNEDRIDKGKKGIVRMAIGLVLILSAYSVTLFVTNTIQTSNGIPSEIPDTGVYGDYQYEEEPYRSINRGQRDYLNTDPLNQDPTPR